MLTKNQKLGLKYHEDFEGAYASIARFLNASPQEIAILENATAAWQAGFHAIDLKDGDEMSCFPPTDLFLHK